MIEGKYLQQHHLEKSSSPYRLSILYIYFHSVISELDWILNLVLYVTDKPYHQAFHKLTEIDNFILHKYHEAAMG